MLISWYFFFFSGVIPDSYFAYVDECHLVHLSDLRNLLKSQDNNSKRKPDVSTENLSHWENCCKIKSARKRSVLI